MTTDVDLRGTAPTATECEGHASPVIAGAARLLANVWANPPLQVLIGVAAPALFAIAVGWWTPRGPMTSGQALASIAISLVVGGLVGLVTRSRWAILVTPVVFAVVFELVRKGTDSTTVDSIHLGSTYGIIALLVVRGFHGVVALVPMMLAAAFGAAFARQISGETPSAGGRAKVGRSLRRCRRRFYDWPVRPQLRACSFA